MTEEDFMNEGLELTPEIYGVIMKQSNDKPIRFIYKHKYIDEKGGRHYIQKTDEINKIKFFNKINEVTIIVDYLCRSNHYGTWLIDCEKFNLQVYEKNTLGQVKE